MEIRRTANAGVLLTLDNREILLDGVCREVKPYLATPPAEKEKLSRRWPDVVAFTHAHEDHFDEAYALAYSRATGREVVMGKCAVGQVTITPVPTRHMGRWGTTTPHQSFVIRGSQSVWFLGDSSPTELKKLADFPKPDVLILPYPYVSTPASRKMVEALLPCKIVLLHMPLPENDPDQIWQSVAEGMEYLKMYLYVPKLGETLQF
jgi:L-ascorbate metabolism protein UlaG (beta-lactamase superfamily)